MNKGQPSKRAIAMIASIQAIASSTAPQQVKDAEIAKLGTYQGRSSKGRNAQKRARHGAHMDKVRSSRKAHNKKIRNR